MDFTQYILLGAVIAGVVELITRVRAKDWWVVVTIVSSAIVGGLFGIFHYYANLDVVGGIVAGLGASGAISAIGATRSTPAKSEVIATD